MDEDGITFADVSMDEESLRSMIEAMAKAGLDASRLTIGRDASGRLVVNGAAAPEPDDTPPAC